MELRDLQAARKAAGTTQSELAAATGLHQADISFWETGARLMGENVAERLAQHLAGVSASDLLISNKAQAFKRAQENNDRLAVLRAAESIVKFCDRLPADPELDAMLDRLVRKAVKVAEQGKESYVGDDGSDALGQKVPEDSLLRSIKGAVPLHTAHAAPRL
jgi:transcriptional regulator with XRE-family HTH domain